MLDSLGPWIGNAGGEMGWRLQSGADLEHQLFHNNYGRVAFNLASPRESGPASGWAFRSGMESWSRWGLFAPRFAFISLARGGRVSAYRFTNWREGQTVRGD